MDSVVRLFGMEECGEDDVMRDYNTREDEGETGEIFVVVAG